MAERNIPESLRHLEKAVRLLRPHPANPRRGDVGTIAASLAEHGQYRAIVANKDGTILAGNHTYKAAVGLGWETIAVTYVDVDEEEAERILLIDNRANDLAAYDDPELLTLLQSLDDLTGTGFTDTDLEDLLNVTATDEPHADDPVVADDELWPMLNVKVPPDVNSRFIVAMTEHLPGENWECFERILLTFKDAE